MDIILPTIKHPKGGYDIGYIALDNRKIFKRKTDMGKDIGLFDKEIYIYVDKTIPWDNYLGPIKLDFLPVYIGRGDFRQVMSSRATSHSGDLLASELKRSPDQYMCIKCATGIDYDEAVALEAYLIQYAQEKLKFKLSKRGATEFQTSKSKPVLINKKRSLEGLDRISYILNLE